MQAVILAAGCGRRMRPFSDACHKALMPIGRTTILQRIVDDLLRQHVTQVTVVTGYRADEVEAYLTATYPEAPLRFIRNERFAETNNVVSLALALEQMVAGVDLLLVECDLLLSPGLLARLCEPGRGNVALVDRYRTGMDGTVVTVANGRLTGVYPPSAQGDAFNYHDTFKTLNVYRFTDRFRREILQPLVAAQAERIDATAYYEVVLATLPDLAGLGIAADVVEGSAWAEVDDPTDLAAARFQFSPEERTGILDRSMGGHWGFDLLDFSFMRNAYFPPPAMLAAMRHGLAGLLAGYGSTQTVINEKLGWFLGCDASRICSLSGASQVFPLLRQMWRGRRIAIPAPTFGEYARMFPEAMTYDDAPGVDLSALERMASDVDVVVVVNPNSPTGTTIPTCAIRDLARRCPHTQWLIDESFIDFSDQPSLRLALEAEPLVNVAVLTSLSKSLGVPGLRLGYLYSSDRQLLDTIAGELPIWHVGSLAEYLLEQTLKFRAELRASLQQTVADREALRGELRAIDGVAVVHPSGGNFLLVDLHGPPDLAAATRQRLLVEEAIEVKDVTSRFRDRVPRLRLAVRRPEENARLTAALRTWLPVVQEQQEAAP